MTVLARMMRAGAQTGCPYIQSDLRRHGWRIGAIDGRGRRSARVFGSERMAPNRQARDHCVLPGVRKTHCADDSLSWPIRQVRFRGPVEADVTVQGTQSVPHLFQQQHSPGRREVACLDPIHIDAAGDPLNRITPSYLNWNNSARWNPLCPATTSEKPNRAGRIGLRRPQSEIL